MAASPTGPLSGIRGIDVTQNLSGPMATMILGDQGADIVKVEPPGIGDFTRAMGGTRRGVAPAFAVINRNKRSAAINLRDPRGLELLKRMVARADLFVQNHRPGVAERLGIGEAALRGVKPDLVYVSISGESGPYADQRVYDSVIQALSGLAAIQADVETGVRYQQLDYGCRANHLHPSRVLGPSKRIDHRAGALAAGVAREHFGDTDYLGRRASADLRDRLWV
jgi:crotonobetainyl-CoA:carnitine CoA-transferase CaiB-like acyl-CoA transferase